MRRATKAPRSFGFQGRAAGRAKVGAKPLPRQAGYHDADSQTRGRHRLLVATTPQGTRAVGRLEQRGDVLVFLKRVDSQRHRLKYPEEAWAVDEAALLEAQAAGATRIEIEDERGRRWWTRLEFLLAEGQVLDRGHGRQVALASLRWSFLPADSVTVQLARAGG